MLSPAIPYTLWSFLVQVQFASVLLAFPRGDILVSMLTGNQTHLVDRGHTLVLDCLFHATHYNMFDNPVFWKKTQNGKDSCMNLMGNILEPFVNENRFDINFMVDHPRFNLRLTISDVALEDMGNYTCEVRGPRSVILSNTVQYVYVKAEIKSVVLVTVDAYQHSRSANSTIHPTFSFIENRPTTLKCISHGGFPPPTIQIKLDRQVIMSEFTTLDSIETEGRPGLQTISHTREMMNYNFAPSAEHDGKTLRCVAISVGFRPFVATVKLDVDYSPQIRCQPQVAELGEVEVTIECEVKAKPRVSAIFWVVDDHGTRLVEGEITDRFESMAVDVDKQTVKVQLLIHFVDASSIRRYTLVAENRVTIVAKEVSLGLRSSSDLSGDELKGQSSQDFVVQDSDQKVVLPGTLKQDGSALGKGHRHCTTQTLTNLCILWLLIMSS